MIKGNTLTIENKDLLRIIREETPSIPEDSEIEIESILPEYVPSSKFYTQDAVSVEVGYHQIRISV